MRRSLLTRLLVLSLTVAAFAVIATALLATYGTSSQLRDELDSDVSLLETDSYIRGSLLTYADNHNSWDGVETLVHDLAEETGRRIALTTPEGSTIVDSASLRGHGAGSLPSTRAAVIDASRPQESFDQALPTSVSGLINPAVISLYGWQMTDQEVRAREGLVNEAVECLRDEGFEATINAGDPTTSTTGRFFVASTGDAPSRDSMLALSELRSCVPEALYAPSQAAREVNSTATEQTMACLDQLGMTYRVSEDSFGMRIVQPTDGARRSARWTACEETAQIEAKQPHVAPPADLYLGTSDRFSPFSPGGWWRTAATVAAILLAATVVTVLAGRRLVRPVLAVTTAAQRMAGGDHQVRVPVSGHDEVTRLGAAFNVMAESIERSVQQRKALVNDVAHELRSPLANVRSHLEAAEDGIAPLDASLILSLREESLLLERLVEDLQDLSLAEAGVLPIHSEERDAVDLASQTVAAQRAQAEAAGVHVRLDAPESVPVRADPARLRQALGNLVSNAVLHTASGGTVDVTVRRQDGSVVLTVGDTGQGIAPEHLPHVFDRFYRADPSRSRNTGGSGLGLAITKHLVEAHGGTVTAASTLGMGSVFTIHLPG